MVADERRTHPRYPFTAAVEAVDAKSRTVLNARTSDIGRGGCYIDAFSPFPLKTPVRVRLTNEEDSFVASANVVYSRIGMGMGLRFTEVEPGQPAILDKWIAELNGAPSTPHHTLLTEKPPSRRDELLKREQWYVLNELILALMRKSVLTHAEGRAMLQKTVAAGSKTVEKVGEDQARGLLLLIIAARSHFFKTLM
jgi:hypothetical protein